MAPATVVILALFYPGADNLAVRFASVNHLHLIVAPERAKGTETHPRRADAQSGSFGPR